FMTSFSPLEAILSSFSWSENSRAGQHRQTAEDSLPTIKKNCASCATASGLIGAEDMCRIEIRTAFERQSIELKLALADWGDKSRFIS
ncbi:hypothetical protein, partial [Burkholderia cenocepacia]|uniref:hypothetical protein n=1 Tax=Burkholderia cenocepacia TaxID=95486 RepID=UPI001E2E6330